MEIAIKTICKFLDNLFGSREKVSREQQGLEKAIDLLMKQQAPSEEIIEILKIRPNNGAPLYKLSNMKFLEEILNYCKVKGAIKNIADIAQLIRRKLSNEELFQVLENNVENDEYGYFPWLTNRDHKIAIFDAVKEDARFQEAIKKGIIKTLENGYYENTACFIRLIKNNSFTKEQVIAGFTDFLMNMRKAQDEEYKARLDDLHNKGKHYGYAEIENICQKYVEKGSWDKIIIFLKMDINSYEGTIRKLAIEIANFLLNDT